MALSSSSVPKWNLESLLISPLPYSPHPTGSQILPLLPLECNPFSPSTAHSQLSNPFSQLDKCHGFSLTPTLGIFSGRFSLPTCIPQSGLNVYMLTPRLVHISIPIIILCTLIVCLLLYLASMHHKLLEGGDCVLSMNSLLSACPTLGGYSLMSE